MATEETGNVVVYVDSVTGQQLLLEVQADSSAGEYQPTVHRIFTQQSTYSSCGIQSCALLLSASVIGARRTVKSPNNSWNVDETPSIIPLSTPSNAKRPADLPYTDLKLYEMAETHRVTDRHLVSKRGTTLDEVAAVLRAHGCSTRAVHADSVTVDQFRRDVVAALSTSDSNSGVIVNFSRGPLKTGGERAHWAHHSPLAAYHRSSDRVLVLDTAAPAHRHFWVKIDSIFSAMSTVDRTAMKSRGYVVMSRNRTSESEMSYVSDVLS